MNISRFYVLFKRIFVTLPSKMANLLCLGKKKNNSFVLHSTFRNFERIRRISLNKGSLGN